MRRKQGGKEGRLLRFHLSVRPSPHPSLADAMPRSALPNRRSHHSRNAGNVASGEDDDSRRAKAQQRKSVKSLDSRHGKRAEAERSGGDFAMGWAKITKIVMDWRSGEALILKPLITSPMNNYREHFWRSNSLVDAAPLKGRSRIVAICSSEAPPRHGLCVPSNF